MVDYQKEQEHPDPVIIQGEEVERVDLLSKWTKTGLVSQHGSPLQESTEQTVLPEETQILQCMQHATEERSAVAIALFFDVVC